MWLRKKKKEKNISKASLYFLVPIRLTTTTEGGKGKKKKEKYPKKINRISHNIRITNFFIESLLSESFPLLGVTVHFTSLGWPLTLCWSLDHCWGSSDCILVLPLCVLASKCPQLSEIVCFLLSEFSMTVYIFHRHRFCLVDPVDLICSLYNWWEGFGSSSLVTLPLGFNCGFISTSACGSFTGVCSWGWPGRPGLAPVRAKCGAGSVAWVTGVLAAPGTQGVGS